MEPIPAPPALTSEDKPVEDGVEEDASSPATQVAPANRPAMMERFSNREEWPLQARALPSPLLPLPPPLLPLPPPLLPLPQPSSHTQPSPLHPEPQPPLPQPSSLPQPPLLPQPSPLPSALLEPDPYLDPSPSFAPGPVRRGRRPHSGIQVLRRLTARNLVLRMALDVAERNCSRLSDSLNLYETAMEDYERNPGSGSLC